MFRLLDRLRLLHRRALGSRSFILCHFSPLAVPGAGTGAEPSGAEMHVLTPFLKYSRVCVKGELGLPVWGTLDYAAGAMRKNGRMAWLGWSGDVCRICNGAKVRVPVRSEDG
jgi:hypothetical protein